MASISTDKKRTLKEALPAPPIMSFKNKTIIFHGVLYGFPDFADEQLKEMFDKMNEVNMSFKYSRLNSILKGLEPYRIRLAKKRIPGKLVEKWTKENPFVLETKE